MADYISEKLPDAQVPLRIPGEHYTTHELKMRTGIVGSAGEFIEHFDLPKGVAVLDAFLDVDGTLGTAETAQLFLGSTALTGATTAATAGRVRMTAAGQTLAAAATLKTRIIGGTGANDSTRIKVGVLVGAGDYGRTE